MLLNFTVGIFDPTKPDGSPRNLLNVQKIGHFGWIPQTSLRKGIELSYADFLKQQSNLEVTNAERFCNRWCGLYRIALC